MCDHHINEHGKLNCMMHLVRSSKYTARLQKKRIWSGECTHMLDKGRWCPASPSEVQHLGMQTLSRWNASAKLVVVKWGRINRLQIRSTNIGALCKMHVKFKETETEFLTPFNSDAKLNWLEDSVLYWCYHTQLGFLCNKEVHMPIYNQLSA